jgi:signal transduction histidine kinase
MKFNSLTTKLTLAFLSVSLIGVALVAIFSRLITEREFARFRQEQDQSDFIARATAYYQAHGSWQGFDSAQGPPNWPSPPQGQEQPADAPPPPISQRQPAGGPPPPMGQPPDEMLLSPPPQPRFALADQDNLIVLPDGPYRLGDRVPSTLIRQGLPLEINGERVGTILTNNDQTSRNPLEEQYLARTNQAVLIAAMAATVIALGAGIFLARTLTRSMRELTTATLAMATGNLAQTVPVRSHDELGQLARAFNRMSAAVTEANRLRRQMTADVAHDLRTPLSVIIGYLEAMRQGDLAPTPARLEAIYTEAQHLNNLIADLRIISLADAGELPLNLRAVNVPDLLTGVAAAYAHQAHRQQIELVVQADENLPPVEADPDRLVQVLGNLVSNAFRYTPEGGRVTLAAQIYQQQLLLRVEDTGRGIPADDLPHIFRRFYRADKARHSDSGESGLGLAIAKAIVEAHHGHISVESNPGQGTRFTILLNIAHRPAGAV